MFGFFLYFAVVVNGIDLFIETRNKLFTGSLHL